MGVVIGIIEKKMETTKMGYRGKALVLLIHGKTVLESGCMLAQ